MIAVIQRVGEARVSVDGKVIGKIGPGLLILLGVAKGDGEGEIKYLADKIVNLRIFDNEEGRFDRSLVDIQGEALVVSQFTLLGDWRKGRRPGYDSAQAPALAEPLVENFVEQMRSLGVTTNTGQFGAHMDVELINDGPVTFVVDTARLK
ncbi:D-aminoacyl-tRNA deacylase [hydrothermal vent metagenome]|uniref:D-aminoacyl-tRNA deacylase n=1 Tax=hydrothermal vent metagenome TaxID=652676 RepID=A0A3B1CBN9_9ZZZZ